MNKEDWMIYEATDKVVKMLDVLCDPDTDPEVVKDTLEMVEADFADAAEDYCKNMANHVTTFDNNHDGVGRFIYDKVLVRVP